MTIPRLTKSVSVIVPTRGSTATIHEAVASVLKCEILEVLVISKTEIQIGSLAREGSVKVIVAPDLNISQARNLGILMSTGDIVAFTDDDCTVKEDWLSSALTHFEDERVAVVGGPGLTHPDDPDLAKCAGAVLASPFGTFSSASRYVARSNHPREATEQNLSTCNLFFRRSTLEHVGFFESTQYPCEENELIERIRAAGYKVLYAPSCIVYHHRRPLFRPFLRQISFYAVGRAVFTVRDPRNFRPIVAAPSTLFLSTILLPILYAYSVSSFILIGVIHILYLIFVSIGALASTLTNRLRLRFAPITCIGIILMHYCYGISFIRGLFEAIRRFRH